MRLIPKALAVALLSLLAIAGQARSADGEAIYQKRCAACHLANGQGVPGAFPPLAGRIDSAATDAAGRQYLVMVLEKGMTGPIQVKGATYQGVMPAQGLPAADAAAVLNYLRGLEDEASSQAFTAEEVSTTAAEHGSVGMSDVRTLRPPSLGQP